MIKWGRFFFENVPNKSAKNSQYCGCTEFASLSFMNKFFFLNSFWHGRAWQSPGMEEATCTACDRVSMGQSPYLGHWSPGKDLLIQ